jgi:arylsulfatase A-like enzyme
MAVQQPNILLIHVDQHRHDCLGVGGHPAAVTPHLDRLAAEGLHFTHAFCPAPICTPARTSLLTGVYATQHGCLANKGTEGYRPMNPQLQTFSQVLKEGGYWLGYVGKWDVGTPLSPEHFGFDTYVPDKGYLAWRRAERLPPLPTRNGWFGEVDSGVTPQQTALAWGADHVISLLKEAAARPAPFFLRWDPNEPHLPNVLPEPYASLVPSSSVPPWPSFPDPLVGKPFIQRQQVRTWGLEGWTWQQWAPLVARYLGVVALIDHQVGRILRTLDDLGLRDSTLVVYTSDHGDLCGAHGMIDKHYVMYDDVVRVPLLLRWPGRLPAGRTIDAFVTPALDLPVTFCAAGGLPVPPTFVGRDLAAPGDLGQKRPRDPGGPWDGGNVIPSQQGATALLAPGDPAAPGDPGPPSVFATYHGNQFGLYSQRMLRTRRWKYVWNATAEDELYDLEADPGELTNLAAGGAYTAELADLRRQLAAQMAATQDPLLNPWTKSQLLEGRKVG